MYEAEPEVHRSRASVALAGVLTSGHAAAPAAGRPGAPGPRLALQKPPWLGRTVAGEFQARPTQRELYRGSAPTGVEEPLGAATVLVVDTPQSLHCRTRVSSRGVGRSTVASRIGRSHIGQRQPLSRGSITAAVPARIVLTPASAQADTLDMLQYVSAEIIYCRE
jgi:hypothetical protein